MIRLRVQEYRCKRALPSLHEGSLEITITIPFTYLLFKYDPFTLMWIGEILKSQLSTFSFYQFYFPYLKQSIEHQNYESTFEIGPTLKCFKAMVFLKFVKYIFVPLMLLKISCWAVMGKIIKKIRFLKVKLINYSYFLLFFFIFCV